MRGQPFKHEPIIFTKGGMQIMDGRMCIGAAGIVNRREV